MMLRRMPARKIEGSINLAAGPRGETTRARRADHRLTRDPESSGTPSEITATRRAVLLAPITARADEHLAPAPGTWKHPGLVHRSPRRGGLDEPRSAGNTALGAVRKCVSGRSLGRDRQVQFCPRLAPVSPAPAISHQRHSAVIALAHGDGTPDRQYRFRWEARPGRGRRDDSVRARSPFADHVKT